MPAMASRRDRQPSPVGRSDVDIERRGGLRAIGATSSRLTAAIADKRGWTAARLIAEWPAIVGAELARRSLPERLIGQGSLAEPAATWNGGGEKKPARPPRRPAALRIRVAGAAALEIQHREPQIVERVNGWFGYRAIDRLKLVQGPLPAPPPVARPRPLDAITTREIDRKVEDVKDGELRAALASLGRAIARDRSTKS